MITWHPGKRKHMEPSTSTLICNITPEVLCALINKTSPFKLGVDTTTLYLPEDTGHTQVPEQSSQPRDKMSPGIWTTPAASDLGAESHPVWYPLTWSLLLTYHWKLPQDIPSEARNSRPGETGIWKMLLHPHGHRMSPEKANGPPWGSRQDTNALLTAPASLPVTQTD